MPTTPVKLKGAHILVGVRRLDRPADEVRRFAEMLSPDEQARAARFHFARDREHYIAGRGTLRMLLGAALGLAPASVAFSYGSAGKPSLAMPHAGTGLAFNVSHSADLAVIAFATNRSIGVDIERVRPDVDEACVARLFAHDERSTIAGLADGRRQQAFFDCWTRKEAYVKAIGCGLSIELDRFSVSCAPGETAAFLRGVEPTWRIAALDLAAGYVGAIVHDGPPATIDGVTLDHAITRLADRRGAAAALERAGEVTC